MKASIVSGLPIVVACIFVAAVAPGCGGPSPTPSTTPAAGEAVIPPRPARLEGYADAIAEYLTANGGAPDCLSNLLERWELPTTGAGSYGTFCLEADADGDGTNEIVVAVQEPFINPAEAPGPGNHRGDLLVFTRTGESYTLAFSARRDLGAEATESTELSNVMILDARDVNSDQRVEVLFQAPLWGATGNPAFVFVIGWDGQGYRLLTPKGLQIQRPERIGFVQDMAPQRIRDELDSFAYFRLALTRSSWETVTRPYRLCVGPRRTSRVRRSTPTRRAASWRPIRPPAMRPRPALR